MDISKWISFAGVFLLINVIALVIIKDSKSVCKGCTDTDCGHCNKNYD